MEVMISWIKAILKGKANFEGGLRCVSEKNGQDGMPVRSSG